MYSEIVKKALLLIPSIIFKSISFINLTLKGFNKRNFENILIISVDNISFGGTGKTPMVIKISEILSGAGFKHAIALRGYGGKSAGKEPVIVNEHHNSADVGDEAIIYRNRLKDAAVITCTNRIASTEAAIREGCRVLILDDGFQSRNLSKDLSIMLINQDHPYYFLRNFRFMAYKNDIILGFRDSKKTCKNNFQGTYYFETDGFKDQYGNEAAPDSEQVTGFSALGDNERFRRVLRNWNLKSFTPYRDHHKFTEKDLENLEKQRLKDRSRYLVCTEKDLVKLKNIDTTGIPLIYLQNRVECSYNLEETIIKYAKEKGVF